MKVGVTGELVHGVGGGPPPRPPPAAPTVAPVAAPMAAFGSSVQAQHEPRRGRAVPFVGRIFHSSTVRERSSTFGPSLLASRGGPDRRAPRPGAPPRPPS